MTEQTILNWELNSDGTYSCLVGFQWDVTDDYGQVFTHSVGGPIQVAGAWHKGCTRTYDDAVELEKKRPKQQGE